MPCMESRSVREVQPAALEAITRTERFGRDRVGSDARPPIGHWTDPGGVSLQDPRATEEASGAESQADHRSGSASGSPGDPRGRPVVRSHRGRARVRPERRPGPLRTDRCGSHALHVRGPGRVQPRHVAGGREPRSAAQVPFQPRLREGARPGLPRSYGGIGEGGHSRPAAQHDVRGGRERGP